MGSVAEFLKTSLFLFSSAVRPKPFVANYDLGAGYRTSETILKNSENIIISCGNARCADGQ